MDELNLNNKISISEAQLHAELIKLFESGNTDKGNCKELLGIKYKIQNQRFYKSYAVALLEWQGLKKTAIAEQVQANAVEALKSAIMSKYERQKVLTDLARGKVEIEEVTDSSQFGTTVFKRLPNPAERRAAIAELNKMDGDYAPTKVAATDKDGNDVKPTAGIVIQANNTTFEIKEGE